MYFYRQIAIYVAQRSALSMSDVVNMSGILHTCDAHLIRDTDQQYLLLYIRLLFSVLALSMY